MRKTFLALAILGAATFFVTHGASASDSSSSSSVASATSVSVAQGGALPIDRVGKFTYTLGSVPGMSIETATATAGFGVQGGSVEFLSPPRTVLTDTADGLVVGVTFNVASFSGAPSLVVHGATVNSR